MGKSLSVAAGVAVSACLFGCGHGSGSASAAPPAVDASVDVAAPSIGRPGDLGANSPVIDHSGPNGGYAGPLQTGPLGETWQPIGCPGTVPIATGVLGAAWGGEAYGTTDPSPHAVHTSWTFDTSSSIAAIWETDANTTATFLAYGDSPTKLDHFVQGVTFTDPPESFEALPYPMLVHETHACGLLPEHTYYFAVGGDGWYGNVYSVRTGPPVGSTTPFRVAVMGDSNAFPQLFAELVPRAESFTPDWVLFTGDMVNDGTISTEWEWWFAAGDPFLAHVPTMTVHGNHEEMATDYFALFALPGVEEIYSFDYGNAHVVVLNDSPRPGEELTGRQATFLDQDLAAATTRPVPPDWLIVSHHRPMFSSDPTEGSDLGVRSAWEGIEDKYNVDVDFNGHSHHYESSLPVRDAEVLQSGPGGVRYIISGGAGAAFDPPVPTKNPWTISYYAGLSLAVLDINGRRLAVQGFRSDGTAIDPAPIVLTKSPPTAR
jgi:acid phosphatase type 7